MENHHFQWENPLSITIFNSYVKLPEGIACKSIVLPLEVAAAHGCPWLRMAASRGTLEHVRKSIEMVTWQMFLFPSMAISIGKIWGNYAINRYNIYMYILVFHKLNNGFS